MIELVRNDLFDFMEASGKSQNQIAKESNVSTAAISQFLKGCYTGNNEDIAQKLKQYLKAAKSRLNTPKEEQFYEHLHNTEKVLFAAESANIESEIALIYGAAGAGKTTALKHFAKQNPSVLFITANESARTPRAILYMIAENLHREPARTEFDLMRQLVSYLSGTKRTIVIDEADHLNVRALQALRNLNDEAGSGLILAGNDKIYNQMFGRGSLQFDQLRTRVAVRVKVANNYTVEEIQNIFVNINDECTAYLLGIANKESLRTAGKCYRIANKLAFAHHNTSVSLKDLRSVQKQLFSDLEY